MFAPGNLSATWPVPLNQTASPQSVETRGRLERTLDTIDDRTKGGIAPRPERGLTRGSHRCRSC
ncbi:MAG: hypothetical protein BGO98_28100 [Myxococcales bacterium 68-20]|nr:MAG: hypothetical protein BGO98_28100 [Myxococcales bacterium 68-20]